MSDVTQPPRSIRDLTAALESLRQEVRDVREEARLLKTSLGSLGARMDRLGEALRERGDG